MGVNIFKSILENAPVSSIHYSKNIPLTDGSTPHFFISKIKEANIPLALDINQTDYRNDGHSYKWHANSYEVSFYDKIHDLSKAKVSDKRAIENDNLLQLKLFERLSQRKRFEILRMEVRLNNRQKTSKLLKTLEIQANLNFDELFNSNISKTVLLNYIDQMIKQRPKIIDAASDSKDFLAGLIIENPSIGLTKTLRIFGLRQALGIINIRELRTMFGKYNNKSWSRLITEANNISIKTMENPLAVIRKELESFMPLKLVDFQDRMINNDKYN